jgi:hypothetical protein
MSYHAWTFEAQYDKENGTIPTYLICDVLSTPDRIKATVQSTGSIG